MDPADPIRHPREDPLDRGTIHLLQGTHIGNVGQAASAERAGGPATAPLPVHRPPPLPMLPSRCSFRRSSLSSPSSSLSFFVSSPWLVCFFRSFQLAEADGRVGRPDNRLARQIKLLPRMAEGCLGRRTDGRRPPPEPDAPGQKRVRVVRLRPRADAEFERGRAPFEERESRRGTERARGT